MAQLRQTVNRYLGATSAAERCQLLTTVYRTENPDVALSGGCQQSQQISAAEKAARENLRVAHIRVRGDQATVTLVSVARSASIASDRGAPRLTGLELRFQTGGWRIDGFTESASATAATG